VVVSSVAAGKPLHEDIFKLVPVSKRVVVNHDRVHLVVAFDAVDKVLRIEGIALPVFPLHSIKQSVASVLGMASHKENSFGNNSNPSLHDEVQDP
jgi:hypothetical protein